MDSDTYHLIGIGGVGMSALAQLLLDMGFSVSGSDRFWDQGVSVPALEALRAAGARLCPQDGSGLASDRVVAVISTAIEADNLEFRQARMRNVRVVHRAELLADLLEDKRLIAVTGTSGKTTVTGMIGWILTEAGFDPTVVNGGAVVGWSAHDRVGSVRCGRSKWAVIEADESDKSLMRFHPDWVVVTNISKDHFEAGEAFELFRRFGERARSGVILGPGAEGLAAKLGSPARVVSCEPLRDTGAWWFHFDGKRLRAPGWGRHNAENAALAAEVCRAVGVPAPVIARAVESFPGVERRLQVVGRARGVVIIDDYAHNPAKIRAAWSAAAEMSARVWGVWRPHGFGPLRLMMNELENVFSQVCRPADRLFLLPVFYAGGTAQRDVSSDDLARQLSARGVSVELVTRSLDVEERVRQEAREGDAVLCMAARDPEMPHFVRRLAQVLQR